jgi:hypothetical protein
MLDVLRRDAELLASEGIQAPDLPPKGTSAFSAAAEASDLRPLDGPENG